MILSSIFLPSIFLPRPRVSPFGAVDDPNHRGADATTLAGVLVQIKIVLCSLRSLVANHLETRGNDHKLHE